MHWPARTLTSRRVTLARRGNVAALGCSMDEPRSWSAMLHHSAARARNRRVVEARVVVRREEQELLGSEHHASQVVAGILVHAGDHAVAAHPRLRWCGHLWRADQPRMHVMQHICQTAIGFPRPDIEAGATAYPVLQ
eukprot:1636532-Prymnesium_polylepis.1